MFLKTWTHFKALCLPRSFNSAIWVGYAWGDAPRNHAGAIFVVDIRREHIAVREANKLNIPIFALVDTNTDPNQVNFGIPANDDATKSIEVILKYVTESVKNGLAVREKERLENEAKKEKGDNADEKKS